MTDNNGEVISVWRCVCVCVEVCVCVQGGLEQEKD